MFLYIISGGLDGENVHAQENVVSSMPLSNHHDRNYYQIGQMTSVSVQGDIIKF